MIEHLQLLEEEEAALHAPPTDDLQLMAEVNAVLAGPQLEVGLVHRMLKKVSLVSPPT